MLMVQDGVEFHEHAKKKNKAKILPLLTEQAHSTKNLLYGKKLFSLGHTEGNPERAIYSTIQPGFD